MITYERLLAGAWNDQDERFEAVKDCVISSDALLHIAQFALAGWTFCGADENCIELERTIENPKFGEYSYDLLSVDRVSGNVTYDNSGELK